MDVINRTAKSVEEIFAAFSYKIDLSLIKHPVCIAHQNLGGDDTRAIYEIYVNGRPRFFGVSSLEFPQTAEAELEFMKEWTTPANAILLEDRSPYFLFEIEEPFGIHFTHS